MALTTWLVFVAAALVSIISPGPAFLVAVRNGMTGGYRRVALSSLGNILGLLLLASAAMLGLGVMLKASEALFTLLKLGGAGYLVYLGVRQWRSRLPLVATASPAGTASAWRTLGEGALVALSNPKAILFFTALFPQFLVTGQPLWPQFLIMVGTFMALSFLMLMTYGALAGRLARWLGAARRVRFVNRVLGSAFIGLGVLLLKLRQPA
ncbi:LysE family translocator [Halomonas sp. HNIBRBA4712]|uniref:LysE family translocator n=1 Tax=Halomonas sp. HNIBRBA4712 TaxID=3373087 RepID=UPI003744C1FB